jgi:hypothetical protein
MKTLAIIVALDLLAMSSAMAQPSLDNIAKTVKDGCQAELNTYCKAVSPGEGRVFACLYAHSDKLSGHCEYALYNVSQELERAVSELNYLATSCSSELQSYCSDTKPGEGRIATCLKRNMDKATPTCQRAIQEVGITAN